MWIAYRFQHVPAAAMAVCQNAALNHLVPFTVGELFRSFTDLEEKIKSYKERVFCELWKRGARTIAAARKRVGRPMNGELKYYELKYCCIHGGQPFKAKGKGIRTTS